MVSAYDLLRRVVGNLVPGPSRNGSPRVGGGVVLNGSRQIGTTGALSYGGYLEPRERDPSLLGTTRFLTFDEMLANTTVVAACSRFFLNLLARANWKVEPARGRGVSEDEAKRRAEDVERLMYDMRAPWHKVVRNAGLFRFRGASFQEWSARAPDEDGVIGMANIAPRPMRTIERWDVEEQHGELRGVWQRHPLDQSERYIPVWKMVYAVDDTFTTDPDGMGLFRHCVPAWRRLQRYEQLEGVGFDTDLRGVPKLRAPLAFLDELVKAQKLTPGERDMLLKPMRDFAENHVRTEKMGVLLDSLTYQSEDGVGTPSTIPQYDVDLLKSQSNGLEAMALAVDRVLWEIALVLGCEHLMLGRRREGSQALSRDKTQNFSVTVDGTLRELAEVLDQGFVVPIFELNGWDQRLRPTLKTEALQHRAIEEVTGALHDLAQSGALLAPGDPAVGELYDSLGLTRPDPISSVVDASLNRRQPGTPANDGAGPDAGKQDVSRVPR